MSFEARIFIQGVANFVPHTDGKSLLALFPDQSLYKRYSTTRQPEDVCRHFPMVQMDYRHLVPSKLDKIEAPWTTFHLDRQWVGFEIGGTPQPLDLTKMVDGVTKIEELLTNAGLGDFADLRPSVLPTEESLDPRDDDLLSGGLYLKSGKVSMASDFTGTVRFHSLRDLAARKLAEPETRQQEREEDFAQERIADSGKVVAYGNTLKVELGSIDALTLKLRRFGSGAIQSIPLHPLGDTLDVWVRYFCEVERPVPKCPDAEDESGDLDFLLNYLLRDDLEGLLKVTDELVIPRITTSWLKGRPVGSDCVRCCGTGGNERKYSSPF